MRSGGLSSRSLSAISNRSWLRIGLSLLLAAAAIFLLARNVNVEDVQTALSEADNTFIAIALLIFLLTLIIKVWRWHWMFRSDQIRPRFGSLYNALVIGQFVNFIFPLRIGELARVYSLDRQSGIGKTKSLSTIIIEKTLDLVALFLSAALLIPFIVLPEFILNNGYPLALAGLLVLFFLIFLAYRTEQVTTLVRRLSKPFPDGVERKINQVLVAGLNGLSSLRNWRLTLWLGLLSFLIAILAIFTPYALFLAFSLPLGFDDALILNLVMTLGMIPPSTPGKILVFEGLVILMLRQFGVVDANLMFSYAIVFHLVVALPQIVLGAIAFARGGFKLKSITENDEPQKQAQRT